VGLLRAVALLQRRKDWRLKPEAVVRAKPRVSVKEAKVRSEQLYFNLPEVAAERTKEKEARERLERIKKTRVDDRLRRRQKQQVTPRGKQGSTSPF